MQNQSCLTIDHLLNNPQEAVHLRGNYASVAIKSSIRPQVKGYIYTMDPVAGTLVLVNILKNPGSLEKTASIECVVAQHIKSIECSGESIPIHSLEAIKKIPVRPVCSRLYTEESTGSDN